MAAKKRTVKKSKATVHVEAHDLWIAPKSNLKGNSNDGAWNDRSGMPTGSRLLELADIALGLKTPDPPKKRRAAAGGAGQK